MKDAEIAPTCTSAGRTEGSHCLVCGTVITATKTIPAKGHTFTLTVTVKATTKKDGSIKRTCGVCGTTEKTTIYRPSQISLAKKSFTYNGKEQKPSVVLWDRNGNQIGTANYTVAYGNNRNVGKAKITVTLSGNYAPDKTQITRLTRKSKGFQVKWKKQTNQTSGYEIQYSDNSKFSKNRTKTVGISKRSANSKDVKQLKAKKKYYVRVRTYKKVKINGKSTKIYSGWSKVKTVVTK